MINRLVIFILILLLPAVAMARPQVSVDLKAEKEILVEENGVKVNKIVPADTSNPGDIIIYTLVYRNSGDEMATNINLKGQIPEGTALSDVTPSDDGIEVQYSVDNGKTFDTPENLKLIETGTDGKQVTRAATVADYNSILWTLPQLPAGARGEFSYKVKVKK